MSSDREHVVKGASMHLVEERLMPQL